MTSDDKNRPILGMSLGTHDTAIAIVNGGRVVFAAEQERFDGRKHSGAYPNEALTAALEASSISLEDFTEIAVAEIVNRWVRRIVLRDVQSDRGFRFFKDHAMAAARHLNMIENIHYHTPVKCRIVQYAHHQCHAASSFYASGFEEALVATFDGLGETESTSMAVGRNGRLARIGRGNEFPHSLGFLYAAVTGYLGWRPFCDEGIVMGLAPYGRSSQRIGPSDLTFKELFRAIVKYDGGPHFYIVEDWISFDKRAEISMSRLFESTFGPPRAVDGPVDQRHADIAAALQERIEEVEIGLLTFAREQTGQRKLCLAGGVALNCSANGQILGSGLFDQVFIQPAAGDAGAALGAAFLASRRHGMTPRQTSDLPYRTDLGTSIRVEDVVTMAAGAGLVCEALADPADHAARLLSEGKIIGWCQGRAEFGPRALGFRSILAAPFPLSMRDRINLAIKGREGFRPLAPAVLWADAKEYFQIEQQSAYMLMAVPVRPEMRAVIPAVTHVDGSARVQTVTPADNELFCDLLVRFKSLTGVPVLLNTSLNVKGKPIANDSADLIWCIANTPLDAIVVGNVLLRRPPSGPGVLNLSHEEYGNVDPYTRIGKLTQRYRRI